MEKKRNSALKTIIAVILLIALIVGALWAYGHFTEGPVSGKKDITVQVVHGDGTEKDFNIKTDEEYLRGALEQKNLVSGSESEYGLFVDTVDGETVDAAAEQWWNFTKDGEMLMTGVDTTPINDGDHYEITLKTGYDF